MDLQAKFKKLNIILIVFLAIIAIIVCKKIMTHERWQSDQIHALQEEILNLKQEIDQNNQEVVYLKDEIAKYSKNVEIEYSDISYNYLAIGNSITKHVVNDYWWDEIGMAATKAENDYYHLLISYLKGNNDEVTSYSYNFAQWEMQSHDRAETFDLISPHISPKLNLITVQLGENVSDSTTIESDFEELIMYLKNKAPNAEIIIIGDFWNSDRDIIKEKTANKLNVKFVSLSDAHGNDKYWAGIGTTVYDAAGNKHIIEHSGVASHPGDFGMEYIANNVINVIDKTKFKIK